MEKPELYKANFEFTQQGNSNGTTQKYESLLIDCESSGTDEFFFVLKSDSGWSIDNVKELQELFLRIENCLVQLKNK
jgi:hypothetical protein